MEHKDAVQLITHRDLSAKAKGSWADLGCGTGTFTLALAHILEAGSQITAIDSEATALRKIPENFGQAAIHKLKADFVNDDLPLSGLNGVLMANSLHYVKEKHTFLTGLKQYLAPDACFLVIEYDSNAASTWVPYPLNFESLKVLFSEIGYQHISRLHSRPSIYGNRNIYAALIY